MSSERVRQLRLEQQHYAMRHALKRNLTLVDAINDLNLSDDPIYRSFERRIDAFSGEIAKQEGPTAMTKNIITDFTMDEISFVKNAAVKTDIIQKSADDAPTATLASTFKKASDARARIEGTLDELASKHAETHQMDYYDAYAAVMETPEGTKLREALDEVTAVQTGVPNMADLVRQ